MDTLSLLLAALDLRLMGLRHEPGGSTAVRHEATADAALVVISPDHAIGAGGTVAPGVIPAGAVAVLLPGPGRWLSVPAQANHLVGRMVLDTRIARPLLEQLPGVMVLSFLSEITRQWREGVLAFLQCESSCERQGGWIFSQRLLELLFIQAVRQRLLDAGPATPWQGLLTDGALQRALALLHGAPQQPWRLGTLAQQAGLSRTVLVERFVTLVGQPPMAYLRQLRLQQARRLLEGTLMTVAQVADQAGYGSEAAFARSFKRHFGVAPGAVRAPAPPADRSRRTAA